LARLLPYLELTPMPVGHVLYESSAPLSHVYFPINSIVSLLYTMDDGTSAEVALVGNEGVVGVSLFMGGETTPNRALVESAGHVYQLASDVLKVEFRLAGSMQRVLLRYTQELLMQMGQTMVCNRLHPMEQQFCRWLLQCFDRLPTNKLIMTQELIAIILGVRRGAISEVAKKMQDAGLIEYHRGRIVLLDRPGLEARACECYAVLKKEFDRLLPRIGDEKLAVRRFPSPSHPL